MKFTSEEWFTAFIWWYCAHYLDVLDPYGYWGDKVKRAILTHIKLCHSSLTEEINIFLSNLEQCQSDYDCLAHMYVS